MNACRSCRSKKGCTKMSGLMDDAETTSALFTFPRSTCTCSCRGEAWLFGKYDNTGRSPKASIRSNGGLDLENSHSSDSLYMSAPSCSSLNSGMQISLSLASHSPSVTGTPICLARFLARNAFLRCCPTSRKAVVSRFAVATACTFMPKDHVSKEVL